MSLVDVVVLLAKVTQVVLVGFGVGRRRRLGRRGVLARLGPGGSRRRPEIGRLRMLLYDRTRLFRGVGVSVGRFRVFVRVGAESLVQPFDLRRLDAACVGARQAEPFEQRLPLSSERPS